MEKIGNVIRNMGLTSSKQVLAVPLVEVNCAACRDTGFVHPRDAAGQPDYTQAVACRTCQGEQILERLWNSSQLPDRLRGKSFENFVAYDVSLVRARDAALQLANGEDVCWLTLMGGSDRGKTHLVAAICRRWIERVMPVRYAYVPDMLDALRDSYEQDGELSFRPQFDALCKVPLLILDDLGVEKMTTWAEEKLNTIVHMREANGLPLVVTTNVPFDAVDKNGDRKIPIRIASRLQRFQPGKVLVMDVPEYRLRRNE